MKALVFRKQFLVCPFTNTEGAKLNLTEIRLGAWGERWTGARKRQSEYETPGWSDSIAKSETLNYFSGN